MDTPEDDVTPAAVEDGDEDFTDADIEAQLDAEEAAEIAAAPPRPGAGRLLLGLLAALVVGAVGVAAWAGIYASREKEYIGVAVIIGLLAGYAMRAVSGRSDLLPRLLAVVVTALSCVAGSLAGEVAFVAHRYGAAFWPLLRHDADKWWSVMRHRSGIAWVVFAAALVIAFLAAGPQKPKKEKAVAEPPGWDVPPADLPPATTPENDAAVAAAVDDDDEGGGPAV